MSDNGRLNLFLSQYLEIATCDLSFIEIVQYIIHSLMLDTIFGFKGRFIAYNVLESFAQLCTLQHM